MPKPLFLLPRTERRLSAFGDFLDGKPIPERYLFFSYDHFHKRGMAPKSNLDPQQQGDWYPVLSRLGQQFNRYISRSGAYGGDFDQALWGYHLHKACDLVIVYTGRLALPLIWMRKIKLVPNLPTILITNGLFEKLEHFTNKTYLDIALESLRQFQLILSPSQIEIDLLERTFDLVNTTYLPSGVDADYFKPQKAVTKTYDYDIISIGADKHRDYVTLLETAGSLPLLRFLIITSQNHATNIRPSLPQNVQLLVDIPMSDIRYYLARSRISCVPVFENVYSGATTVVLQSMAMGIPTIANEIGANIDRSFFRPGENIVFAKSRSASDLAKWIRRLLETPSLYEKLSRESRFDVTTRRNLVDHSHSLFNLAVSHYQ